METLENVVFQVEQLALNSVVDGDVVGCATCSSCGGCTGCGFEQ